MEHGARQHATFGSSNAHRVLGCPGATAFCAGLPPRPDSEASSEGTKAHELLASKFDRTGVVPDTTPEMHAAVDVVVDYLEALFVQRVGNKLVLKSEQPFHFPQAVVPADAAQGIADLMVFDPVEQEVWAIEFKYGMVSVEAPRNPQLLFNACGMLWHTPFRRLNLVVIQPRVTFHPGGVIREWSCGPVELVEFQGEMEAAIQAAERNRTAGDIGFPPVLTPGAHCRYCPAEHVCPARERSALAVAFGEQPPVPAQIEHTGLPDPRTLDLARITHILRHADTLATWLRAVEKFAHEQARNGVTVPGYKLVEAQARRRYAAEKNPLVVAADLAQISGLSPAAFLTTEVLGVTEAEAKIVAAVRAAAPKGGKDAAARAAKERLAFFTVKSSSGTLTLVPDTDGRPAANPAAAAFAHVSLPPMEPTHVAN